MRLDFTLAGSALLIIGAAFAYLFLIVDRDASSPALAQAPAVAGGGANPASSMEVQKLIAALLKDREDCYGNGRNLLEPEVPACARIGLDERQLVEAGAELPPSQMLERVTTRMMSDSGVETAYLKNDPGDRRSAEEVSQDIVAAYAGIRQDRDTCYSRTFVDERECMRIGYIERSLIHFYKTAAGPGADKFTESSHGAS